MKHNSDVPGQLTLLTVAPTEKKTIVHDPYWDETLAPEHPQPEQKWNPDDFGEVPHKVADDGQLTIFYDDSQEPPDPDDFKNLNDYHQAWADWEIRVRAQVASSTVLTTVETPVRAQVKLDTRKFAPEHNTHWVEKYWVERSGNKYWYFRYCWMTGRKKNRRHIGSVNSIIAKRKKADVEVWITDGKLPIEIEKLIRGWKNESPPMPKM
ncbi:MAG: DUF4102 domain-containing protein [Nostoc sp.]|uniref:DUF4102 domain-containing protein n=1 Tax=Nostoc sp. TaxID=1180 RepID=UPI002FFAEF38